MQERPAPPVYYVLFHTPGIEWDTTISFKEQPGIEEHIEYMSGIMEQGKLVMGGPFLDDSGGMMILITSKDEAASIAQKDPAVMRRLLEVKVIPWLAPMSSANIKAK